MRTRLVALLALLALFTVPCPADWGQAESSDFTLDTTVPEPALMPAAALPLWLLLRRRRPAGELPVRLQRGLARSCK
jgi:uncharacterized protein (TIGR03382 family)